MSKPQTPNPNEVMDVERQMYRFSDNPRAHMLFQTYRAVYREKGEEALADIAESVDKLVAQQNAALLRELLTKKKYVPNTQPPKYTIPASILEAKLKSIEEEYGR
jgi:citrate synthase